MSTYTKEVWEQVTELTMHNKETLLASTWAGCYCCLKVYPATTIDEYVDLEEDTALCPECGVDYVIGDATGYPVTDKEFLEAMHHHGFTTTGQETS